MNLPDRTMQNEPQSQPRRLPRRKLVIQQTPTQELGEGDWAELLPFFRATYEIDTDGLKASVLNRTHLIRVRERASGRLVGTTAFGVAPVTIPNGESARVFYAGDVLLLPNLRGSGLVQEMAARVVLAELLRHPFTTHYGFGVALTHYAYLGVVRSFADAWPRRGRETPPEIRFVMDTVGRMAYSQTWRSADESVAVGRRGRGRDLVISEEMMGSPNTFMG
ncbi:MAG: hypothetical protein IPK80_19320 [Nannocystis sp.]|nr:hypothetical protein [Nannocystis sp.]